MNQSTNIDLVAPSPTLTRAPLLARASLFSLSLVMLSIGVAWRIVDIFVLGLGGTSLNILPSKIFPLSILLLVFWVYRRSEISSILGLSRERIRAHITIGLILGISFFVVGVVIPSLIGAALNDPPSTLTVHMPYADILWYEFLFLFVNAIMEETLFRGILYHGFLTRTTINRSMVLSAIVFGFWHICWPFANGKTGLSLLSDIFVSVVFSGILGLFFSIYYVKFTSASSLAGPIVAHTLVNFLNESFKIGSTSSIQGPDTPLSNPLQIALTGVFFLLTVLALSTLLYKYKIEQIIG